MHLDPTVLSLFVSTTIQQCIITEPVTRILDLLFYGKAFIGVLTVAVQDANPTVCVLCGVVLLPAINKETNVQKVGH